MNEPIYLSQCSLARQLGVAPSTLAVRISTGEVTPDAKVINGDRRQVGRLFLVGNVARIKDILNNHIHKARS